MMPPCCITLHQVEELEDLVAAVGPRVAKILPPFAVLRMYVYCSPTAGRLVPLFRCLKPLGGVKCVDFKIPPEVVRPGSDERAALEEVFGPEVCINEGVSASEEEPLSEVISDSWNTATCSGSGEEDLE
jgi:hypothetical protein